MPAERPWHAAGVCFECTRCGDCCRGHGLVELSDADIARLAGGLSLTEDAFRERYTRPLRKGRIGLIDQQGGDCVFLDCAGSGCTVYADRPEQCRSYPFWPSILHSEETWQEEASRCEGIGRGASRAPEPEA